MVKPNLKSDVYLRYCSYHRPYTAPIILYHYPGGQGMRKTIGNLITVSYTHLTLPTKRIV